MASLAIQHCRSTVLLTDICHLKIRVPVPDDCRPPVDVMFGQLLGLFFSLRCKLTPDQPVVGDSRCSPLYGCEPNSRSR
jgi:hypothetical protein